MKDSKPKFGTKCKLEIESRPYKAFYLAPLKDVAEIKPIVSNKRKSKKRRTPRKYQ